MFCPTCGSVLYFDSEERVWVCGGKQSWTLYLEDTEGDGSSYQPHLVAVEWDEDFWGRLRDFATVVQFRTD